jgi:hypothetical protein
LSAIVICIVYIVLVSKQIKSIQKCIGAIVVLLKSFSALTFVGTLFVLHTYLIITNKTTSDISKRLKVKRYKTELPPVNVSSWKCIVRRLLFDHFISCCLHKSRIHCDYKNYEYNETIFADHTEDEDHNQEEITFAVL